MRIVHIEETFHPEYGYQVQNLCRYHSNRHEIHVVTASVLRGKSVVASPEALARLDSQFTENTGAKVHRLPVRFQWRDKTWLGGFHECLRQLTPDVIYAHGFEYLSLPRLLLASWQERAVVVADSHDLPSAAHHRLLRRAYHWLVQRWYVRKVNREHIRCYYVAPPTKDLFLSYGVEEQGLRYLPLGTSIDRYAFAKEEREDQRRIWGIKDNDFLVVYTGKHDHDKQPHLLYEALERLPALNECGRLWVVTVGSREASYFGEIAEPLLEKLKSMGVGIHVIDPVPALELRQIYCAADVVVFPARSTLSSLDAMACGAPVVMQDDSTNADRLAKGGLVFPPGDVSALTNCLATLRNDLPLRERLARRARLDMEQRFDYQAIVRSLEEDLENLVQNRQYESV